MASPGKLNGTELLEVDICDGVCSEDESGVFVNCVSAFQEDFSGFQQWTNSTASTYDTSSPPGQQVPSTGEHGAPPAAVRTSAAGDSDSETTGDGVKFIRSRSIVDCLLVELYETYNGGSRRNLDSWDSSTEASGSDAFLGRSNSGSSFLQELQEKHTRRHQMNYLAQKAAEELHSIIQEVKYRTGLQSAKLLRQLKRRDRLSHKVQKNYDIITACLQAVSQKRRQAPRRRQEAEGSEAAAAARVGRGREHHQQRPEEEERDLPECTAAALHLRASGTTHLNLWPGSLQDTKGMEKEGVWLTLAEQYLHTISIDWDKTLRFAFNERSNPDDDSLGIQIVKDLHRTGCSSYCGQEGEQDRVVLKRVLLAYARWNKSVGYCQGFNVLAALILEVTEGHESDALKVMIYLIDKVLPESYFANNLRALSVDMAVFRDLLRLKLPRLSQHLHQLQKAANKEAGGSYEPPLTNVFTMQWFLTMFATCLPAPVVLKIWDSVFFEGSEEVYAMAVFPFPQLAELREKYTYNITPFPTSVKSSGSGGLGGWESDDDAEMDDEDSVVTALGCLGPLGGLLAPELHRYQRHLKDHRGEQGNIAELSPGAVGAAGGAAGGGGGARAEHQAAINSMMMERMSTDICALKKQYTRIKRRQQQQAMQLYIRTGLGTEVASPGVFQEQPDKHSDSTDPHTDEKCPATRVLPSQLNPSSTVINHLLLGRKPHRDPRGSRPTSPSTSTLPVSGPSSLSQSQGSPTRQRCASMLSNSTGSPGSCGGGSGSPWRAHVRVHRRNIAMAREQLGFGDSEERENEESEEERKIEENEGLDDELKEGSDSMVSPDPSGSVCEEAPQVADETEVAEVVVQLDCLDLEDEPNLTSPDDADSQPTSPESEPAPQVPLLPPPPSLKRHQESDSSGSERSSDRHFTLPPPHHSFNSSPSTLSPSPSPVPTLASLAPSSSSSPTPPSTPVPSSTSCLRSSLSANDFSSTFYKTSSPSTPSLSSISSSSRSHLSSSPSTPALSSTPKQQVYSPFPSVKQPRKSAAARNLGLYGPTSRTPTVHFPSSASTAAVLRHHRGPMKTSALLN
ncbi:hypothetical protein F7725_021768 [Dissostichus mawsoni]|uniref:Rab-GAP TBC domain-containing protein n=1 Tax=Dissostichus mawsoni TaxID=36200 RepID=A0A7J5ZEE9_DISMA|nr:hypothetical protein F7725_021768 [Dissostichus mawsoni]